MLAAQVECKVLKLIFGGAGIEHYIYPDQTPYIGTMWLTAPLFMGGREGALGRKLVWRLNKAQSIGLFGDC